MINGSPIQLDVPVPNLKGDDVPFVRKDAGGNVTTYGIMNRANIAEEAATGSLIEETATLYVPPPSSTSAALGIVQAAALEMNSSDRYFLTDALNYIDGDKQQQWAEYRKALHKVLIAHGKPADVLQALPGTNPDGVDAFAQFRKK